MVDRVEESSTILYPLHGERRPDSRDECRRSRSIDIKRCEVRVIRQHSLVDPSESLVSGLRLGRIRENCCESQLRMLTGPAEHEFFLVNVLRLACAPVEVDGALDPTL